MFRVLKGIARNGNPGPAEARGTDGYEKRVQGFATFDQVYYTFLDQFFTWFHLRQLYLIMALKCGWSERKAKAANEAALQISNAF
jgi:hypothetical protein